MRVIPLKTALYNRIEWTHRGTIQSWALPTLMDVLDYRGY
jgi:hypothetical protein